MALFSVTVNKNNMVLPNGQIYQSGALATLSDAQFAMLDPAFITNGDITNNGAITDSVTGSGGDSFT